MEWIIPSPVEYRPGSTIDYEPGFRSDYVEPWHLDSGGTRKPVRPLPDQPGPPTCVDDPETLYRVFFTQADFDTWLRGRTLPWKQDRVVKYLAKRFENQRVPPKQELQRKQLRQDIIDWDTKNGKILNGKLDDDTLKTAIEAYDAGCA